MGMNVNRWLKYAKTKLDSTVQSGNEELDRLEAKQEAERADRPWLGADDDAPTFEEAQARIRWEAEEAERTKKAAEGAAPAAPAPSPADGSNDRAVDPTEDAASAEQAAARLELDARAKASAERLEQIRRELGVDHPPAADPPPAG